tara:strand:+ start:2546 stop:2971 length:426 start_codon:yes stop_codon:yes gene_type:complete
MICCVYKLETPKGLYIGSTKNFKNRKKQHKYCCKARPYVNKLLYEDNDFTKFKFSVLEENPTELLQTEQKYIDLLKPKLNAANAYGEKLPHKEYMKEYITRQHYCDCGATVLLQGRARHLRSLKHKREMKKIEKIMSVYII